MLRPSLLSNLSSRRCLCRAQALAVALRLLLVLAFSWPNLSSFVALARTTATPSTPPDRPVQAEAGVENDAAGDGAGPHPDAKLSKPKQAPGTSKHRRKKKVVKRSYVTLPELPEALLPHKKDRYGLREMLKVDLRVAAHESSRVASKQVDDDAPVASWMVEPRSLISSSSTPPSTDGGLVPLSTWQQIIDSEDEGRFRDIVEQFYERTCRADVWHAIDDNEDGILSLDEFKQMLSQAEEHFAAAMKSEATAEPAINAGTTTAKKSVKKSSKPPTSAVWAFCFEALHAAFWRLELQERTVLEPDVVMRELKTFLSKNTDFLEARRRAFDSLPGIVEKMEAAQLEGAGGSEKSKNDKEQEL
ncbi:unnamed protein product [Amoebophrya sp. A120]|nr:unnamed protein product [Amoebophrya sp. A120]|eukprot:GSA120T00017270001.1